MIIAVSAVSTNPATEVDPRFGRCACFLLFDDNGIADTVPNQSHSAARGAGIATAQALIEKGVGVVLTGSCGPKAYQVLSAAGVTVVTGATGKTSDAVDAYRRGVLKQAGGPNVEAHFGTGGRGMGRP